MTTSDVTFVHCDYAGCDRSDPQPGRYQVPDGWTSFIYTHACPDQEHTEALRRAPGDRR